MALLPGTSLPFSPPDPPPRGIRHLAVPAVYVGKQGMERGRGWVHGASVAQPMRRRLDLVPPLPLTTHGLKQVIYSVSTNFSFLETGSEKGFALFIELRLFKIPTIYRKLTLDQRTC